jgi:hypothetical protein
MGDPDLTQWNDKRRPGQRIDPRYKKEWPAFEKRFLKRLRQGHREYGDQSFDRPLSSLLEEQEQELFDVVLWGFIGIVKMGEMIEKVKELEGLVGEGGGDG